MTEELFIQEQIQLKADELDVDINDKFFEKIAKAKKMMFGKELWYKCPCDSINEDRYCGSELCQKDIEEKGICHCNLYIRKEK